MKNVSIFQITAMTAAYTAIPDLDCSLFQGLASNGVTAAESSEETTRST